MVENRNTAGQYVDHIKGITTTPRYEEDNNHVVDGAFKHCYYAIATYDFAVDGGAQGNIDLGVTVPDNALIMDSIIEVLTPVDSDGTPALDLGFGSTATDIVNNWAAKAVAAGPVDTDMDGSASTMVKLAADKNIYLNIGTADLTAGKFKVIVQYFVTD